MHIIRALTAASFLAALAIPAVAETSCPEGAVDGKCVSPRLAELARQGAVERTQTHLSISNHNYPPSDDWQVSYPNNVSGAPQYNSGRLEAGGMKPKFHSIPFILYGIPN